MVNRKLLKILMICSLIILTGCAAQSASKKTGNSTEISQTEDSQDTSKRLRLRDAEETAGFQLSINLRTTSTENDLTKYFTSNRVYEAEAGKIIVTYHENDGSDILSVTKAKGETTQSGEKTENEETGRDYYLQKTDDVTTCTWTQGGYSYELEVFIDVEDDTVIELANKVDYDETIQLHGGENNLISVNHEAVPTFAMTDINGEESDFLTKISEEKKSTVLFIGAQWCQDCRREMAVLQKEKEEYKDSVQWYYVTFARDNEEEKTVKHDTEWYMEQNDYDIPVYYVDYSDIKEKYNVSAIPTILFINEKQEIVGKVIEDSYGGTAIYNGIKLIARNGSAEE